MNKFKLLYVISFQITASLAGILAVISSTSDIALAQFCTDPSHTALTKARLDELATNQGISTKNAPLAF